MANGILSLPRRRRRPRALVAIAAALLMGATFDAGVEMANWRLAKMQTLPEAIATGPEQPRETRLKALVAMQRYTRMCVYRTRALTRDDDESIAKNAEQALLSFDEARTGEMPVDPPMPATTAGRR